MKREIIVVDWDKERIYHNNIPFSKLSETLKEKLPDYDIQHFAVTNTDTDGQTGQEPLFYEII